jgi:DNA-binding FadR family transcriptional regulator
MSQVVEAAFVVPRPARVGHTLGAHIAHQIEQKIRSGGWQSGHLIGSESDICEQYGAGTSSVREAARILEARGLAKARRGPGGGLFVTAPDKGLVTDAARRYLSHIGVERSDLFEVWLALERLAVSKLAETVEAEGAARLRAVLEGERQNPLGPWTELPNVHLEIIRQSGNPALELFVGVLSELSLHTYGPDTEPGDSVAWLNARHTEIVEAIIAGDGALAQLHLRHYIDAIKRQDFSPSFARKDA